jgi:chromosome partition protein MukF
VLESLSQDPSRVIALLAGRGVSLELETIDLCLLAALHVRASQAALPSFTEQQLLDAFEEVSAALDEAGESTRRRRAAACLRRLREQRLLSRIDGAGVVRAGEFALSRLATGIIEFYLEEESLTRENLAVLTRTLHASLLEVLEAARRAQETSEWHEGVVAPLRVTVAELVAGIERRQSAFDAQQEELQREIGALLQSDWFGAVERCQSLLEVMSTTLRELNEMLLRDAHQLQGVLQDVQELAVAAAAGDAEHAVRRAMEQVDRIGAWGSARQRAWSEYYQYVHRFLRDVVRLDPSRALAQRLRELLSGKSGRPHALRVAAAPPLRLLRPVENLGERPPVRRPRKEREKPPAQEPAEDPQALLEARVRSVMKGGAQGLVEVTRELTAELEAAQRFAAAGRIAQAVAGVCHAEADVERPWVPVRDDLVVEEWRVPPLEEDNA